MKSKIISVLTLVLALNLGNLWANSGTVELLITRAPERGLISESEIKSLGLNELLTERTLNRRLEFCEKVPQASAVQIDEFHRALYDFLAGQEGGRALDVFSADLKIALGHDSNVSNLPANEWFPSNQSSPYYDWNLGLDWNGRRSPWGKWALGVDFNGRNNDRKSVTSYDYSMVGADVSVEYNSGWHWSLANNWWMYSPRGTGEVGDIRWDYLLGYKGQCNAWWNAPMDWKAELILQRDDFRHGSHFAGQDRYRYGVQGQWLWKNECKLGRGESYFRHAWLLSDGSVDTLDYTAVQSEFQSKLDFERSVCNLVFNVQNEKRLSYRRAGSKSNDSLWMWKLRLERPLWSNDAMGFLALGIRDLEARLETVTFHSEEVTLGMEWAW